MKLAFLTLALVVAMLAVPCFAGVVHAADTVSNTGEPLTFPNPFGTTAGGPTTLYGFIEYVLKNIVMPIGAVIVVFFLIYSGYLFVTAQGSEDKLEDAKKMFYGVVIGAVILLGSWAIALAIKGTVCQIADNSIPGLCI